MIINTENPTTWDATAADVQVGDRYRSLGRGYIGRDVTKVERMCNCQAKSRSLVNGQPVHAERVIITADELVSYLLPTTPVALTDGY